MGPGLPLSPAVITETCRYLGLICLSIVILGVCNMRRVTHDFHQWKAKEVLAPYAYFRSRLFRIFASLLVKADEFRTEMSTFMIIMKWM